MTNQSVAVVLAGVGVGDGACTVRLRELIGNNFVNFFCINILLTPLAVYIIASKQRV